MRACLEGERKSLTESLGAMPSWMRIWSSRPSTPRGNHVPAFCKPFHSSVEPRCLARQRLPVELRVERGTQFQNVFNNTIEAGESIDVNLPELAFNLGGNELELVKRFGW